MRLAILCHSQPSNFRARTSVDTFRPSSEYYDAFVSIQRGLFNTRDRAEHTRKRKTVSHTFSAKSIAQFEPYIQHSLSELVKQWDSKCDATRSRGQKWVDMDCLHWFNYLAFDIIGDLVRSYVPFRLHLRCHRLPA